MKNQIENKTGLFTKMYSHIKGSQKPPENSSQLYCYFDQQNHDSFTEIFLQITSKKSASSNSKKTKSFDKSSYPSYLFHIKGKMGKMKTLKDLKNEL